MALYVIFLPDNVSVKTSGNPTEKGKLTMKNYVVILTLNSANEVFATFHKVETLDPMARQMLEVNVNNAQELPTDALDEDMRDRTYPFGNLQQNTLYVFQFDGFTTPVEYNCATNSDSAEEHLMRLIGFRKCDRCGSWVCPQEIRNRTSTWDGTTRLCPSCVALANENPSRQVTIHGYHGSGSQFRYRQMPHESMSEDNFQGLGFELEIDGSRRMRTGSHFSASQEFARWNRNSQNLRFENDGSLNNGFEMISQCFSIEYFRNLDLAPMFAQARALGADDAYPTSGLHWHFSKTLLGDTPKEQALNFLKIMFVLSVYANDFKKISGRDLDNANAFYYCGFANMETVNRYKAMIESDTSNDPFYVFRSGSSHCGGASAFLIPSGKTIEYRFFKSCTNPEKFRHIAELLIGLTSHIKDVKWSKIYCMGKVFKGVPSETMEYWRKNGAFLNTYATTARGESIALAQAQ